MRLRLAQGLAGALVVVFILGLVASASRGTSGAARRVPWRLANFTLASSPPSRPGTICPARHRLCANAAAEPAIQADGAGRLYASSENGLLRGTDAWVSRDGGRHFRTLSPPNQSSSSRD